MQPLRVLTWHIHGNYLYYLVEAAHRTGAAVEFLLPVKPGRPEGYGGTLPGFPWPGNVRDVDAAEVEGLDFDVVLFQSHKNYLEDQYDILSERQRRLPRIFLEHNPPREHPTNTRHPVDDPNILLVHVTHFNDLMWDNGRTPTRVIEHGVLVPDDVAYEGSVERGIVIVNGMARRARLTGADVFLKVRKHIPLDLVGMDAKELGGVGEVVHDQLHAFASRYRFFFNPIRYTSLGLAVCEAMMIGMPVVGVATTELGMVIENGVSGYVSTDVDRLTEYMRGLLIDRAEAQRIGRAAQAVARERFSLDRFGRDWSKTFALVAGRNVDGSAANGRIDARLRPVAGR